MSEKLDIMFTVMFSLVYDNLKMRIVGGFLTLERTDYLL